MKEIIYKDWQKNPAPRVMWVWNSKVEDRLNQMVLYVGWEAMNGDGE